VFKDRSIPQAT